MKPDLCRQCGRAFRPGKYGARLLVCIPCYSVPEVRRRFATRRQESLESRRLPKEPTHHRPGTEEKVEVMRQRYERGEHIHHPDDAQFGTTEGE